MHEPYYDPEYWGCETLAEADLPDSDIMLVLERVNPWRRSRFYVDVFPKNETACNLDIFHGPLDAEGARRYVRDQWKRHDGQPKDAALVGIDHALKDAGRRVCMPRNIGSTTEASTVRRHRHTGPTKNARKEQL